MRIDKVWVIEELELADYADDVLELIKDGELEPDINRIAEYFSSVLDDYALNGILFILNGTEFAKYLETDLVACIQAETDAEIEAFVRDYLWELVQENLDEEEENLDKERRF